jgi:hypothetical protein
MNPKPRTTRCLLSFVALVLASASPNVLAQQRGRANRTPVAQSKQSERARRALALTLLAETADKARTFDDLFYRARVQALAADALWPHNEQQARAIFHRAWEAAAASDKAEQEEAASEEGMLPGRIQKVTEARDVVLRAAAARDARLAEIFLRDLSGENDEGNAIRNEPARRRTWLELSATSARRLSLAYEMLDVGEIRRAVEIAAPLMNEGVNASQILFILHLRERAVTEADALYLRLLERAAADSRTDSNAVLLLSTPVISPGLMVFIDEFGSLQFTLPGFGKTQTQGPALPQKIQNSFYNLAASVLSRPMAQRGELTMQELTARFYATGRLLPFFENSSAPYAAYAPTLRARHAELFNEIEASNREQVSSQFNASANPTPRAYVDPLRVLAEQLEHAPDSASRERIALSMVRSAVRNKYWDRARRAAAAIEDLERRRATISFIQIHQIKDISNAYKDEKEDDFEGVAKFVREADVPPFIKAWGFAQTLAIAARKRDARSTERMTELINEAEAQAARAAQGTPERVAAYGVIVLAASRLDAPRAWSLLREFVKSANGVEAFKGDEDSFDLAANADLDNEGAENFSIEAEAFRLDLIFATMAHLDFDKALTEARALDGDVPQAFATIAVARASLENRR